MSGDGTNRSELAEFLRSRRQRVDPMQVGLSAGPRRRTAGLRREEVAVLAGLSPTWYAYIEQARDVRPSPEVIDSLARVLLLSEDERRYMHVLAFGAPSYPRPLACESESDELATQLVAASVTSPDPVYAVNIYCDVIAMNPAVEDWYGDLGGAGGRPNILRWLLCDPAARQRLPDWEQEARDVTARWRSMVARRGTDQRIQEQIAEFRTISPGFSTWWNMHDVREHRSRPRRFRHPERGDFEFRLVVAQSPEFGATIIVFHLPTPRDAELSGTTRPA